MSGTYFTPLKKIFLNLSGGTVTGDTVFTQGVYANRLSGGTISSGSTDLYNIFQTLGTDINPFVQPGSNILTGGTGLFPIISVVPSPSFNGLSFSGNGVGNTLSVVTISGGTIYSGATNLYTIFLAENDELNGGSF